MTAAYAERVTVGDASVGDGGSGRASCGPVAPAAYERVRQEHGAAVEWIDGSISVNS